MNYLKLTKEDTKDVADSLNQVLAEYHIYYQKLRNFHWNVKGKNFFDLHEKFEELYESARLSIDEVAERILTLKHTPISNLTDYLSKAEIKEAKNDLTDEQMVHELLNDHAILIDALNDVVDIADETGDEGTIDLIGGYIGHLEKESWMLHSWTEKQ